MDFTFLLVVMLMLLAVKSGNIPIGIALFAILLITAKNKYLIAASIVGAVLAFAFNYDFEYRNYVLIGGLFLVLILILKTDSGGQPAQEGMYGYGGAY